jgi:hypothetical protein
VFLGRITLVGWVVTILVLPERWFVFSFIIAFYFCFVAQQHQAQRPFADFKCVGISTQTYIRDTNFL